MEKFISLDNLTEVDGLLLAGGHRTFRMEDDKITEQMRFTDVSELSFIDSEKTDLSPPKDARFLDPIPSDS